jgi:hypothetical protein
VIDLGSVSPRQRQDPRPEFAQSPTQHPQAERDLQEMREQDHAEDSGPRDGFDPGEISECPLRNQEPDNEHAERCHCEDLGQEKQTPDVEGHHQATRQAPAGHTAVRHRV